jgi:hypothetical protein
VSGGGGGLPPRRDITPQELRLSAKFVDREWIMETNGIISVLEISRRVLFPGIGFAGLPKLQQSPL